MMGKNTGRGRFWASLSGLFYASLAAAMFLLCLGYHPADPAWTHWGPNTEVHHFAGSLGAYMADLAYALGGYAVYTLAAFWALIAYCRFRHYRLAGSFVLAGSLLFVCSAILWSGWPLSEDYLPMGSGGVLGQWLGGLLHPELSPRLLTALLWGLMLLNVVWIFSIPCLRMAERLGALTLSAGARLIRIILGSVESAQPYRVVDEEDGEVVEALDEDILSVEQPVAASLVQQELPESVIRSEESGVEIAPSPPKTTIKKVKEKSVEPKKKPRSGQNLLPELELLESGGGLVYRGYNKSELAHLAQLVKQRLAEFGVSVEVMGVFPGPIITRFELDLAAGTKVAKVSSLAKDIARALSVVSVRVVEVIPGKPYIGLEIPNKDREIVRLREILDSHAYTDMSSPLSLALGKDIAGDPVVVDLAKMPHLLIAGTTGSGKSVGVNAMLLSLLYKADPSAVRFILIDPKMLELSIYDGIPHLLTPVVTDMKDAACALRWCVAEMERRYQLLSKVGVRHLAGFNQKVREAAALGEPLRDPLHDPGQGTPAALLETLPMIVVVIDEFADMIMVVGKKVEELIARIAQKARAAGIHLVLATQRPSVDVITGLIKANIPTRIAFQVSSRIDSRTILDQQGAEQLLGHGDLLYLPPGTGVPVRVHGAYVADDEVHRVVAYWRGMGSPEYEENITQYNGHVPGIAGSSESADSTEDPLYDEAVRIITESRKASISLVQRRLKIGYNRAARLLDTMEQQGVIGPMQSNGQREVQALEHSL